MVLLALRRVKLEGPLAQAREKAFLRGLNWLLSMQSSDGGWAAFDIDNTKGDLHLYSFRRPQRHDRSSHDRRHRARAGSPGPGRLRQDLPVRPDAPSSF